MHWNVIPWPGEAADRKKRVTAATSALLRLLAELPDLRGIVTLGKYGREVRVASTRRTERYRHLQWHDSSNPARSFKH